MLYDFQSQVSGSGEVPNNMSNLSQLFLAAVQNNSQNYRLIELTAAQTKKLDSTCNKLKSALTAISSQVIVTNELHSTASKSIDELNQATTIGEFVYRYIGLNSLLSGLVSYRRSTKHIASLMIAHLDIVAYQIFLTCIRDLNNVSTKT